MFMDDREWAAAHRNIVSISTYCAARASRRRMPAQEGLLALDPQIAYLYAFKVVRGRFPEGEEAISRSPEWSVRYARFVLKGRFRRAERFIIRSPRWAYEYAAKVVKGRLPAKMHKRMESMEDDHFARKYLKSDLCRGSG